MTFKQNRYFIWSCTVLLIIYAAIIYKTRAEDYDVWFHLKYGELFIKNMTWSIDPSIFSWTPSDKNWEYVTWVGSSILYLVYKLAKFPGLVALQWSIFLSIVVLYYAYIRKIGERFDIVNITTILLAATALNILAIYIKPEMFTLLFFTVMIFIYFDAKSGNKDLFYLYPILFLIWVNTHGGFIIGLLVISLITFLEALNIYFIKRCHLEKKQFRNLLLSIGASYITILINPYGLQYHISVVHDLFGSSYMEQTSKLLAYQGLWNYLLPKEFAFKYIYSAMSLVIMAITLTTIMIYAYAKHKFVDFSIIVVNCILLISTFIMARMVLFFPIMWIFSLSYIIYASKISFAKERIAPMALIVFLFFGGCNTYYSINYMQGKSWFGSHIDEWVPVKEAAFIKTHKLPGPIFNDYIIGGYMIWSLYPDYKVFIDPRYGPYVKTTLPDWTNLGSIMNPEGLTTFNQKYPFKTAFILLREEYIINWFLSSPDWKLVYFDQVAAVIVRKSEWDHMDSAVKNIDLGPSRFKDIDNPVILKRLFDLYLTYYGTDYAKQIYEIYKQNVPDYAEIKDFTLQIMQLSMELRNVHK